MTTSLPPAGRLRAHPPSRCIEILLVEDHADTARALTLLLGRDGYSVRAAASVEEALRAALAAPFDLLICDFHLPDGTCLDLMQELPAKLGKAVPAIALTGRDAPGDRERITAAGFAEHLVKPVSFEQLEAAILRVCGPA